MIKERPVEFAARPLDFDNDPVLQAFGREMQERRQKDEGHHPFARRR